MEVAALPNKHLASLLRLTGIRMHTLFHVVLSRGVCLKCQHRYLVNDGYSFSE